MAATAIHESIKSEVHKGQIWMHKKTGKVVEVMNDPEMTFTDIELKHSSGRITHKQQHYFLYDYKLV